MPPVEIFLALRTCPFPKDLFLLNMAARLFYDRDCDLNALTGKTVVFIGYGNQGRAQALNLVSTIKRILPMHEHTKTDNASATHSTPKVSRIYASSLPTRMTTTPRPQKQMASASRPTGRAQLQKLMCSSCLCLIKSSPSYSMRALRQH